MDLREKLPVLGSITNKSESDLRLGFKQVTKGKPSMLFARPMLVRVNDKSPADWEHNTRFGSDLQTT